MTKNFIEFSEEDKREMEANKRLQKKILNFVSPLLNGFSHYQIGSILDSVRNTLQSWATYHHRKY